MIAMLIIIVVVLIAAVWLIGIYNSLVKNRNLVKEGWSGMDVQLKRRADLIPNLLETVKGYMGHERSVLEQVTALRARGMQAEKVEERAKLEGALSRSLANLFAVAEGYPDLKANQNFLDLQTKLADLEEQIQMARRYYNGTVRDYNIKVESFPSNLVANLFVFKQADFFEIAEESDRAAPGVSF
jgi:LemA protein